MRLASMQWNLADLFEVVADSVPERLALGHGVSGVARTWAELERRTNALARHFARTQRPGEKVAIYATNRPEWMEAFIGALKARLVPVNVNCRYREQELLYLFDNSDASAVVYEAVFADSVAKLRDACPGVRAWIEIDDGEPGNAFADSSWGGARCASTRRARRSTPRRWRRPLELHPAVADATVVGVPDERWGEAVTGVVQLAAGARVEEQELQAFVRERLAGYKAPKRIVFADDLGRSPSGKADSKHAKTLALGALDPASGAT